MRAGLLRLRGPRGAMAALCGALAALGGCGPEHLTPNSADEHCSSPSFRVRERATPAPLSQGSTFDVDLSRASASAARVILKVERSAWMIRVRNRSPGGPARFLPVSGRRFVAVVFRFENRGKRPAQAADSVGRVFAVRTAGAAFRRVDRDPGCAVASSRLAAVLPGLKPPETEVPPGRGYRTVLVYSVPRVAVAAAWLGAGHTVLLRPSRGQMSLVRGG